MDEEDFKKTSIKKKQKRGGIHEPLYGTWAADSMLRAGCRKVYAGGVFE